MSVRYTAEQPCHLTILATQVGGGNTHISYYAPLQYSARSLLFRLATRTRSEVMSERADTLPRRHEAD